MAQVCPFSSAKRRPVDSWLRYASGMGGSTANQCTKRKKKSSEIALNAVFCTRTAGDTPVRLELKINCNDFGRRYNILCGICRSDAQRNRNERRTDLRLSAAPGFADHTGRVQTRRVRGES